MQAEHHLSAGDFAAKWRQATTTEKAGSQEHFIDLCRMLSQPTPHDADPTGESYAFEKRVSKAGGGDGFADVWKRDFFAWEYRGKYKDLKAAYVQLLAYKDDLRNPPLLIVSDIDRIEIRTNFTGLSPALITITLDDLAADDPSDATLGVLHSRVHELWARAMGTQLREVESGFRYTPTTCFETFPFPDPTPKQRERVGEAARRLLELRDGWLNPPGLDPSDLAKRTLTNLYNQRPTWLANAHADLDAAVLDAYGWPTDLSGGQVLERLLALNLERAGVQAGDQVP